MFLPAFQDLIKPQWRVVLEELKYSGSMPVSDLSRKLKISYMAVKQHCNELTDLGYIDRTRIARAAVGRPEIFYSLSTKADALFPQIGAEFLIGLLEDLKSLHGESSPDKLLFQHFQKYQKKWASLLDEIPSFEEKIAKLISLREQIGGSVRCQLTENGSFYLEETHNPLQRIFEHYPRAITMERRMIEQLLKATITRREMDSGRHGQPRVIFELKSDLLLS